MAAGADDPFADLEARPPAEPVLSLAAPAPTDWTRRVLGEGAQFKKEVLSQFAAADGVAEADRVYSRQSLGFEVLKRFSTPTATVASFDAQARLVRRDNYLEVIYDMEGADRDGWFAEYHNLYLDLYNVLNPVLDDASRSANVGRFNLRAGRFYLPFGLNLQTDTHATTMQLSNDRNFGYERDWYAGLFGGVNRHLNYDLYYLAGSGYDLSWKGQEGLMGTRLSLGNRFASEHGLEGGLSLLAGERIAPHSVMRSPSVAARSDAGAIVDTLRAGIDARHTRVVPGGTLTYTTEWSVGRDESDDILTQLHQLDYLARSRRLGLSAQYRRFWQDIGADPAFEMTPGDADASLIGEIAWYLRNDVGNANLESIRLNLEQRLERQDGDTGTIVSLQYYRYW